MWPLPRLLGSSALRPGRHGLEGTDGVSDPPLVPQQGLSLDAPVGLVVPASPMPDLGLKGWVLTLQGENCTHDLAFRLG